MPRPCSVCAENADQGLLQCEHVYCKPCFSRYVHGSVEELMHHLRCTICGRVTILTTESKNEKIDQRFGRELYPRLYKPTGVALRQDGSYVTVDTYAKRLYVFSRGGELKRGFPYVHNYTPMQGMAVNMQDEIVVPCKVGSSQTVLAHFRPQGGFLGSSYLPPGPQVNISALTVNRRNETLAADTGNGCIYVMHERRRVLRTVPVPTVPGEARTPEPQGIAVNCHQDMVVTDAANHCVKIVSDVTGDLVRSFGSRGERPGQFLNPRGVCVDSRGRILVADQGNKRVQLFDNEGNFLHFIVRYVSGEDVYMSPISVLPLPNNMAAILLCGDREAAAAEIRIYSCVQVK